MEFAGKKVLVFGTGISGIAAAKLLENVGAAVVLFDGNQELDKKHVLENFEADHMPELYVGELPEEVRDFQSGARSNWHIDVKKVMYLRLPEQTERQRPLHCLERS